MEIRQKNTGVTIRTSCKNIILVNLIMQASYVFSRQYINFSDTS